MGNALALGVAGPLVQATQSVPLFSLYMTTTGRLIVILRSLDGELHYGHLLCSRRYRSSVLLYW